METQAYSTTEKMTFFNKKQSTHSDIIVRLPFVKTVFIEYVYTYLKIPICINFDIRNSLEKVYCLFL